MASGHLLSWAVTSWRVRSARVRRVSEIQNKVVRKGITEKVTSEQRSERDKALVLWLSERRVAILREMKVPWVGTMLMPKEQQRGTAGRPV